MTKKVEINLSKEVKVERFLENTYHLFYEKYPKECAKAEKEINALVKEIIENVVSLNKKTKDIATKIKKLGKKYPSVGIGDTDTDEQIAVVLGNRLAKKIQKDFVEDFYTELHKD